MGEAEKRHGRLHPAPLGNIWKRKKNGKEWKNRIFQDLKANGVNGLARCAERLVLPRGIDHAVDLEVVSDLCEEDEAVWTLILDYVGAFMSLALAESERRFSCATLDARLGAAIVVWRVLGFGPKANPLVYGRCGAFAARSGQALLDSGRARLQLYVDDPAAVIRGTGKRARLEFDILLLWWLVIGLDLSWSKESFTSKKHEWIGIGFEIVDGVTSMTIPPDFAEATAEALKPLCLSHGTAALAQARTAVGKASRIAQVIPEASPFAASLWAALAGAERAERSGRREAPPQRVVCRRFCSAAIWFRTLLEESIFPLRHFVHRVPYAVWWPGALGRVQFDASPWGGGAVLLHGAVAVEYFAVPWEPDTLERFGATLGDPSFQSLWEFLALLIALMCWGQRYPERTLPVEGDNIAALKNAMNLKGKDALNAVAR